MKVCSEKSSVDVRIFEHRGNLADEWPAAVQQNEIRFAHSGIVKQRLQQQRIVAGDIEISARAGARVDVHGHAQSSALGREESENIILQGLVLAVAGVGFFSVGLRGVADVEAAKVSHLEFFGDGSGLLVAL